MKDVVCVTGGTGGIGRALLAQLVGRYEVRALFRERTELAEHWIGRGCIPVWGDLSNEEALESLVRGAAYVFHCAALIQGPAAAVHEANVEGTRRLARRAALHRCRRFVHVSSISVYTAAAGGPVFTEDAVLTDSDELATYARSKLRAEAVLAETAATHGLDHVILRPTCVYGPHVKTFTLVPIDLVTKGLPAVVGDGNGLMDAVYVDDVARALVAAAETPAAKAQVFNIGHETVTLGDFYGYFGDMLNRPVRHLRAGILDGVHRLLGVLPGPAPADLRRGVHFIRRMATSTDRFPSDKARRLLGYEPQVRLPVGMLLVALWGRGRGLVPPTNLSMPAWGFGPVSFSPSCVIRPETEQDLVAAVRLAAEHRMAVRAVGALHSQAPVPNTDGLCIVLDRYCGIVRVEGAAVTVRAGMRLRALHQALAARGLALPVSGTIAEQTIAGAVSTGTHGGSLHRGALSDYVDAIELVRADGTVATVDRWHESFHGAVLSLGLLGIVSTLTLRCVPLFRLQSASAVRPLSEVLDDFDAIQRGHEFVNMLYYPVTDQVEILTINPAADSLAESASGPLPAPEPAATVPPVRRDGRSRPGRVHPLALRLLSAAAWAARKSVRLQRVLTRRSVGTQYQARSGPSYELLAFQDREGAPRTPGVLRDMEFAVPVERAVEAIRVLRDHFRAAGAYPLLPVHIRCSARSDCWLSPAYQRDVCWIEFWDYPPTDEFSRRMQALLEPFRCRFHWGKAASATPEYIAAQYDRWEDFVELRNRWDPDGMFGNAYLNRYFGQPRGDAVGRGAVSQV